VHLEHEIRSGLDQLGLARAQDSGRRTRGKTDQQLGRSAVVVARSMLAFFPFFFFDLDEGYAGLGVF